MLVPLCETERNATRRDATRCNSTRVRHRHARIGTSARRPIAGVGLGARRLIYNGRRCGRIRHQYHADGRPGAWTIIVPDKGYGGVYTYPVYTSSLRLFTQLTRHVLRKRVGPRRGARAWANTRARVTRRARMHFAPNQMRFECSCAPREVKERCRSSR